MAKPQYPSEKLDQYMLRFPDGMRDQLKKIAENNGRSLNSEIIKRLEDTLAYQEHVARHADAPEPSEADYGLALSDHLKSHPAPGVSIMSTLGTILDEVRALRGMSITDIRHHADGRREVELMPATGADDDVDLPDPAEPFPKRGDEGYDEAVLDKVRSIAARYGFSLVKREDAKADGDWDWSNLETPQLPRIDKARKPAKKKA
ncbi:Arc family DNA-binding protein [Rhizobium sp. NPDC090275]|uniref:Arc family DNA-binding protein n=1 Tax=Rhizobium sp. NPDC090275 TaxID=3364498 RepID=UPI00383B6F3D